MVRENQQSSAHNFVKDFSLFFPKICRLCPLKKGAATENPLEYGKTEVEKTINTKSGKTTYKGLTIEMMESYINAQENPVALCAEFESIRQFAKNNKQREYPLLKQWFVEKFKEQYEMTDAKKIHAKHVMAKVTGKVVKLAAAKPAVNQ